MKKDQKLQKLLASEYKRQKFGIELIPSENYASRNVRSYLSSCFVNKYSEGYPKKRYYGGNEYVDSVEELAQERAKKLFKVPFVNVQPYSGSPANLAVYLAVCQPGDVIMGQALTAGGHLTHGHSVSSTGIFYKAVQYGLKNQKFEFQNPKQANNKITDLFDYNEIRKLAKEHKPKLIWCGATAYPIKFNYKQFAEIADEIGAYLVVDIAHVAGLIAGGVHPSPVPYVHIVTTTTHKTLRGPRGAMIMVTEKGLKKDSELPMKINKAVFPGLQGGPHDNTTAGIAAALFEASQPSFKTYARQILKNSKTLAKVLMDGGIYLVGGGSENHLILVDLTPTHGPGAGIFAEKALDAVSLTLNKNTVPNELSSPFYPSGIRLGTPAATSRGMKEREMKFIGKIILEVLAWTKKYQLPKDKEARIKYLQKFKKDVMQDKKLKMLRKEVSSFASKFLIP